MPVGFLLHLQFMSFGVLVCVFLGSVYLLSVGLFLCFGCGYVCGLMYLLILCICICGDYSLFLYVSVCVCVYISLCVSVCVCA